MRKQACSARQNVTNAIMKRSPDIETCPAFAMLDFHRKHKQFQTYGQS